MKNKHFSKLVLLVFCIQLLSLLFSVIKANIILKTGHDIKIGMTGYDPYDPLRGRYIYLKLLNDEVPIKEGEYARAVDIITSSSSDVTCYAVLDKNDKYNTIVYITLDKPKTENVLFIKADLLNVIKGGNAKISIPRLEKYYVNEKLAHKLEDEIRRGKAKDIYLNLKVMSNGDLIIDSLGINGNIY